MGKYSFFSFAIFIIIFTLGIFLRLVNISSFKFYPDSYQSLLVAENIKTYHSVVGFLGNGMIFPPHFMWSRPVYPLLINFFNMFVHNEIQTALFLALFLGILAIPLIFFLLKTIFKSNAIALSGMLLFAISFQHTVWSGFLMTETTGIFFMILFLFSFFSGISKKTTYINAADILTGILLTIAIFTRYEYAIITFPVIFFIFANPTPLIRFMNIIIAGLLTAIIIFSQLYPVQETISIFLSENRDFVFIAGILLLCFPVFIIFYKNITYDYYKRLFSFFLYICIIIFWVDFLYLILQILFPQTFSFLLYELSAIRNFLVSDILLFFLFLVGITVLFKTRTKISLIWFVLFSIVLLEIIYHKINPDMQRYLTHLIPFLLIPASYGFYYILRFGNILFRIAIIVVLLFQIQTTYYGMKTWKNGEWFRISYEEKAAKIVAKKISPKNTMLIVSFPEPYYFFSHISTNSIADIYPYVFLDDSLNNDTVFIVDDMPMRDIFPHFSHFLITAMKDKKIDSFYVHELYHNENYAKNENSPVILYKTTIGELKRRIKYEKKVNNR